MTWSILVVDDEIDTLQLLRVMLEMDGFEVFEAFDGIEAIESVNKNRPDAVLMDVMMPRMDGLEACRILREQPETATLPIIVVSAKTQVEAVKEGLDAGATRYLKKPISRSNLIETIREVLEPLFII